MFLIIIVAEAEIGISKFYNVFPQSNQETNRDGIPIQPAKKDLAYEMVNLMKAMVTQMELMKLTIVSQYMAIQQNIVRESLVTETISPPQDLSEDRQFSHATRTR